MVSLLHLYFKMLFVSFSFFLLKLFALLLGRMPDITIFNFLCFNWRSATAHINPFVMWLVLSLSKLFVPQIITTVLVWCGIIDWFILYIFNLASRNSAIKGFFSKVIVPGILVAFDSVENRTLPLKRTINSG